MHVPWGNELAHCLAGRILKSRLSDQSWLKKAAEIIHHFQPLCSGSLYRREGSADEPWEMTRLHLIDSYNYH